MASESTAAKPPDRVFHAPDGLELFQYNPAETRFLYQEIFKDQVYFRHGIAIADGNCVFDVGANIGLFSLFCQERFKGIQSYAFEPCPPVFEILSANLARYGERAHPHPCAVSDGARTATFTFYPRYSNLSGLYARADKDQSVLRASVRGLWNQRYPDVELEDRHLDALLNDALDIKQEYACTLRPLCDIIAEARIDRIDLLKVDAEGSELDVLKGIGEANWPRIRQIVMEIHDAASPAAAELKTLLHSHGFRTVYEQQSLFLTDSSVVNCFATR